MGEGHVPKDGETCNDELLTAAHASDAIRVGIRGTFLAVRNPVPEYYIGEELPLGGTILNRVDLVAAEGEVSIGQGSGDESTLSSEA